MQGVLEIPSSANNILKTKIESVSLPSITRPRFSPVENVNNWREFWLNFLKLNEKIPNHAKNFFHPFHPNSLIYYLYYLRKKWLRRRYVRIKVNFYGIFFTAFTALINFLQTYNVAISMISLRNQAFLKKKIYSWLVLILRWLYWNRWICFKIIDNGAQIYARFSNKKVQINFQQN